MATNQKTAGLSILNSRKLDLLGQLSERAKEFFQPSQGLSMANTADGASTAWDKAVRKFAVAAAACGVVASVSLAPTPAQADTQKHVRSEFSTHAPTFVNLNTLRFSDLVAIRDRIGLDEATLRDHGMPFLDDGLIARMDDTDRRTVVLGFYSAANSLASFDRAMAESRASLEQRGAAPRTDAEEIQAWQHQLDSKEHRQGQATGSIDQAALDDTINEVRILLMPRGAAVAEAHHEYERER